MRLTLGTVTLAALLTGCALPGSSDPEPSGDVVGSVAVTWSQAEYDALGDSPRRMSQLLTTEAERTSYLTGLPAGIDTAAVRRIDLESSVIVAGAYNRCMEQGRVLADPLRFDVFVAAEDQDTKCGWAPMTVEIWEVPRDDLAEVPEGLSSEGGRIVAAPVEVWSEVEDEGLDLGGAPDRSRLIRTGAERSAFLAGLPRGVDTAAVEQAELSRHLLVTWLHSVCVQPEFRVDEDHAELRIEPGLSGCRDNAVPADGLRQLDVWQIPRTELAVDVRLR